MAQFLFLPGMTVATPGALAALSSCKASAAWLLIRHLTGDWGDIHPDDTGLNEQALRDGSRIFSVYRLADDTKLWIITEADRSSTCILLPSEY